MVGKDRTSLESSKVEHDVVHVWVPWIASIETVSQHGRVLAMRSPIIAIVDVAHHSGLVVRHVFILAPLDFVLFASIQQP